jgi:2-keto-4-pentenoate hydratase
MVTDRLTQWGIVVGGGVPTVAADVNGVRCVLLRDGKPVYAGVSGDELDDHYESLRRLAAGLAVHGHGIEAGQRVITGAFARYDAAAGERWRAEYSGVGHVEVTFG